MITIEPIPSYEIKATLSASIDNAVIAIYTRPAALTEEYKLREAGALAYKAAGYTGTVPQSVKGFATSAAMTPQAATDLILAQAAGFKSALAALADLRMVKFAIARTTAGDEQAIHDAAMVEIAAIAAQL